MKGPTVFACFSGIYSDRQLFAVFSTLERAQTFWREWNAAKLAEYPDHEPDREDIEEIGFDDGAVNIYREA